MIKGVNLRNWLVLEKWMSPGLFAGTTATFRPLKFCAGQAFINDLI